MELSTTNGHITIDYLFIYQPPICFPLVHPAHSIVLALLLLAHTVNNLFLREVKAGFHMHTVCIVSPT